MNVGSCRVRVAPMFLIESLSSTTVTLDTSSVAMPRLHDLCVLLLVALWLSHVRDQGQTESTVDDI